MHVGSRTRSPAVRLTESSKALSCVTNETRTRGSTEDLQLGQVRRGLKRKPDKSASLRIASARHADRVPVSRSVDVGHLLVLLPLYSCRRMRVTDDAPSRRVQPRGLGARRGSTQSGQKELALLGKCEPQRGNGIVPTALPQDRPMATRSLLSCGSDQGHDALELNSREVLAAG